MRSKKVTQLFAGLLVTAMVVTGTVIPSTTAQAKAKSVTIKTQKQLDAALKDPKVTSITIKTSKGIDLKIKTGDYGKKNLVINAPKATVNNYGNFKKISIQDGKTVYDRGKANNIAVSDKNSLKLYAGKQSKDTDITITSKGSKITIVNNGSVDSINVKGKSSVTVGGSAKEAPTITNNASGSKIVTTMDAAVVLNKSASLTVKSGATLDSLTMKADATVTVSAGTTVNELIIDKADANVDLKINGTVGKVIVDQKATINVSGTTTDTITVENNASGSEINSAVKTDVSLNADAKISLEKGAEGSTVKTESADVKPTVENKTDEKVTVTDSTGKDSTIDSGKTDADAKPSTGNTNQGSTSGGSTGGGSTGGNIDIPSTPTYTTGVMVGSKHYNTFADAISNAKVGDTIKILSDVGSSTTYSDASNYDISKAVTITANDGVTIYGTLTILTDNVKLDKLTVVNRGGGADKQKNAINVVADKVTITNCHVRLNAAPTNPEGVANGLCLYPVTNNVMYQITDNTFEGYNADFQGDTVKWTSTAVMLTEGYALQDRFEKEQKSAVDIKFANEDEIASSNTYQNCKIEWLHNDYSTGKDYTGNNEYIYDYCIDGTAQSKFSVTQKPNAKMVLVANASQTLDLATTYPENVTIELRKGNFVLNPIDGNNDKTVTVSGKFILGTDATLEIAQDCKLVLNGTSDIKGSIKGDGTVDDNTPEKLERFVADATRYSYQEDAKANKNWMSFDRLTVDGTTVTADFTPDDSIKEQIQKIYDGLKIGEDGNVTEKDKEAKAYAIDKYVMNTFARYLGALYRIDEGDTISQIKYDDETYQWDDNGKLRGSNWKAGDTTLVSAVVDSQENKAIRDVAFTLVGENGKEIPVRFIASNVPNEDIITTRPEPAQE